MGHLAISDSSLSMNFPSTSYPHPTPPRLSQSIRFELHESYSKFLLSIYFHGNACFQRYSLNSSQAPPSPLCPQVCFMSASPLLPCQQNRTVSTIFLTYFTWYHRLWVHPPPCVHFTCFDHYTLVRQEKSLLWERDAKGITQVILKWFRRKKN